MNRYRVGLVGAGGISRSHVAAVQEIPSTKIVAVADVDIRRAEALARVSGATEVYTSVEALIASGRCNVAHVLVPPNLHCRVAEPLLEAGIHALVEKPMATTSEECEALLQAAARGGALLGVNHNSVFGSAYLKMKAEIESGQHGNLRHLVSIWNVPLSLLEHRRFDLWPFRSPQNMVLEQAVHPIAQLALLAGRPLAARGVHGEPIEVRPGLPFYGTWQVSLELERATAQIYYAVGQSFPSMTLTAICDDGVLCAELLTDGLVIQRRTRLTRHYDALRDGLERSWNLGGHSIENFTAAVLGSLRLRPQVNSDARIMNASIASFYAGLDAGHLSIDGRFGADIVAACEWITAAVRRPPGLDRAPGPFASQSALEPSEVALFSSTPRMPSRPALEPCDIVLFGGAGVIGTQAALALARDGLKVRVIARNAATAVDLGKTPGIEVVQADAENDDEVDRAVRGAKVAVDLVFPKDGEDVYQRMLDSAERIAIACLRNRVEKLIYVSSIEALYLGDAGETINSSTPPDPRSGEHDPYASGKADSERLLLQLCQGRDLDLCILRPGIVVGTGCPARHAGVGRFVNPQHCVGFHTGNHPLPFVLVDDAASAIVGAARAGQINGKAYNLVGDVRLTAREYVREVARVLRRPIRFHAAKPALLTYAVAAAEAGLKRLSGRRDVDLPSMRTIQHARLLAHFDCSALKRDLGWFPVADRAEFIRRGIDVHAPPAPLSEDERKRDSARRWSIDPAQLARADVGATLTADCVEP